ncbi:MAG: hypothetical protein ACREP6_10580 [Candidatus Binataceae bacterium]
MITEAQIQEQLFNYLTRQITLNEFEDWLAVQSWNMHRDSGDAAQRIVGAIELRFAEYSNNHLTDDAIERELKGLLSSNLVVMIGGGEPIMPSWTSSTVSESSRVEIPLPAET